MTMSRHVLRLVSGILAVLNIVTAVISYRRGAVMLAGLYLALGAVFLYFTARRPRADTPGPGITP